MCGRKSPFARRRYVLHGRCRSRERWWLLVAGRRNEDIVGAVPAGVLVAAMVTLLIVASPASEGRPVELRWDAPQRCPDEAALRGQVDEILGGSLGLPRPRPLSVIAVVRDQGDTLSLRVFTVGEAGMRERALRYDRDCELLTRAAAVVIAITIDPASIGRLSREALTLLEPNPPAPEPPPEPEPTPEASPEPPPAAPVVTPLPSPEPRTPPPAPADPPRAKWRPNGSLRALGGIGVGELPGVGGGVTAAAALVFRHLRIELAASVWPARRLRINGTGSETGGDFLMWSLGPRLCGVLHPQRLLEVPLCAGVEVGQVHVQGVGLEDSRSARVTWIAGVVAPALVVVPLRRLGLWLAPELLIPTRANYSITGIGSIFSAQPVAGRVMAGIELRFP